MDNYVGEQYDLVVTVRDWARESCPIFPGAQRVLHRAFEDPDCPQMSECQLADVFRRARDEIGEFCRTLVARRLV